MLDPQYPTTVQASTSCYRDSFIHLFFYFFTFSIGLQFDNVSRMVSSGLLRRVALARTYVSEELGASFIRVTKICELGTKQAATSNRRTLRRNTNHSDEVGARFLRNVGSYKSHTA
jgi:hypothetical protein